MSATKKIPVELFDALCEVARTGKELRAAIIRLPKRTRQSRGMGALVPALVDNLRAARRLTLIVYKRRPT